MSMTQADMAGAPQPMPAGAPPEDMDMAAGEPTADDAMMAMEDERMAQMEAIAAAAPQPEKPFNAALIQKLADEINGLMVMVDEDIAQIDFQPTEKKIDEPIPSEVFVPLVLTLTYVAQLGYEKYAMDPSELVNDSAVRKAMGLIKMMQKDKKLVEELKQPSGEPMPEEDMDDMPPEDMEVGEMPGDFDEEDEALMNEMGV